MKILKVKIRVLAVAAVSFSLCVLFVPYINNVFLPHSARLFLLASYLHFVPYICVILSCSFSVSLSSMFSVPWTRFPAFGKPFSLSSVCPFALVSLFFAISYFVVIQFTFICRNLPSLRWGKLNKVLDLCETHRNLYLKSALCLFTSSLEWP